MKTRAAVLARIGVAAPYARSLPLHIADVDLAPPGPGEVLLRILAAGLCRADLAALVGDRPRPVPMVLGHEACGEVLECGNGVADLRRGDRVVVVPVPSCGSCLPCAEGRPVLCEPGAASNAAGCLPGGERRLSRAGSPLHHHLGASCFAAHAVVSRRSCVKIESTIGDAEAALFGCAVLTGVGAVVNTARLQAGSRAAVLGLGGAGLSALLAAVAAGARDVVAVDADPARLALARRLGATAAVAAAAPDAAEAVRDITRGGVDYAFETAGTAAGFELAWKITRRGGTTVCTGAVHPAARFALAPMQLVGEERSLRGSPLGSCVPVRDIPRYIDLYQRGRLPIDRLMGEHLPLEDINRGLDRLASGQALRDLVLPGAAQQAVLPRQVVSGR